MDLKDFIAESLSQVIDGVCAAQLHAQSVGAFINPPDNRASSAGSAGATGRFAIIPGKGAYQFEIRDVEFDIAVTVSSAAEKKGGLGVAVSVVSLGGSKVSTQEVEQANRLKFAVPVAFPHHPLKPNAATPAQPQPHAHPSPTTSRP